MTKKLGPVIFHRVIIDCMDCPALDADESYSFCNEGGFALPIYRRDDQIIRPPAKCPLRKVSSSTEMKPGEAERDG